jgi:hypothetical protein
MVSAGTTRLARAKPIQLLGMIREEKSIIFPLFLGHICAWIECFGVMYTCDD